MYRFNHKAPYTTAEIALHQTIIQGLHKDRGTQLQLATLEKVDSKQQKHLETIDLIDTNIDSANRSLNFMLEKNNKWHSKHNKANV